MSGGAGGDATELPTDGGDLGAPRAGSGGSLASGGSHTANGGSTSGGGKAASGGVGSGGAQSTPGGEGGASEAAGGSSGPTGDCASDLKQLLPQVEPECPATRPETGDECDIIENGVCVWQDGVRFQSSPGYTAMGCYATSSGKRWYGYSQGVLGMVGVDNEQCPHTQVAAVSSCAGHAGQYCYYPFAFCSCAGDDATWSCTDNEKPDTPPREVQRLCPPAGIDEATAINALSDEAVLAWCNWYADPNGGSRPAIRDDVPQYDSTAYASTYNAIVGACLPELPVDYCVRNLRLHPSCDATVRDLDDCVETLRGQAESWVGHGCSVLLSSPDCNGVIVAQWSSQPGSPGRCSIPLQ